MISNYITHEIIDVIPYSCPKLGWSMLVNDMGDIVAYCVP